MLRIFINMTLAALFLPGIATAQTTHNVTVEDNFFSPSSLTIQVGDTVQWDNAAGGNSHNITSDNGTFGTATASSFTYSFTFNSAGSNPYECTIHNGMTGTITVQGASEQPDLAVQSVDAANGTYAPGDSIPVDVSIQNKIGRASCRERVYVLV